MKYSDLSTDWSAPQISTGTGSNEYLRFNESARGSLSVGARGVVFSTMVQYGHLLPGASYDLTFPIFVSDPQSADVSVAADTGVALDAFSRVERGKTTSSLRENVPPNSTGLSVRLTFHAPLNGSRYEIFPAAIRLAEPNMRTVTVRPGLPASVPKRIDVIVDTPAHKRIRVLDAPRRFILVQNSTYSPLWRAVATHGATVRHIRANLFENGWLVLGSGSYDIDLSYDAAAVIRPSEAIAATLLVLGFLLHALRKRHPSRESKIALS